MRFTDPRTPASALKRWATIAIIGFLAGAAPAASGDHRPSIPKSKDNTFVYDHQALTAEHDGPFAIMAGDGDVFQVLVTHTDPTLFDYTISATQEEAGTLASTLGVEGTAIPANPTGRASVTMRHDRHFGRYRVTIAAAGQARTPPKRAAATTPRGTAPLGEPQRAEAEKEGALPEGLYPVSFDLWVITKPAWAYNVTGGVAFSGLTDHKYFLQTDSAGKKTVEEDTAAMDRTRHDVIALANIYYDRQYFGALTLGAAFGIGDNGGANPRYFIGPSLVLGKNLVFTAGMTFGNVAGLPVGQSLHAAPINGDNTLTTLGSRYEHGAFFGVSFGFINREPDFKGGFSSSTTAGTAAPGGTGAAASLAGTYQSADAKTATVALSTDTATLTLTLSAEDATALKIDKLITLKKVSDTKYSNDHYEIAFQTAAGKKTSFQLSHDGTLALTAEKK